MKALLKALCWVIMERLSKKKTFLVSYNLEDGRYSGEIKARSWEEAKGICEPRGYKLDGQAMLVMKDSPLARWLTKLI